MPELPEVEVVRAGLERHARGRTVTDLEVFDDASLRRHRGGEEDFANALLGRRIVEVARRGKFLWLPLDDGRALTAHLGMSGQLLVHSQIPADPARHLRVRLHLDEGLVDFVDQRKFGGLAVTELVPTVDGAPGGQGSSQALIPDTVTHIARDLLDPHLDLDSVIARIRKSQKNIKILLLEQTVVSGIGNIYADEGLWQAQIHGLRRGSELRPKQLRTLLEATADVMERALAVGGTSFDELYVNADGEAGYFARSLNVYGREGQPCPRCEHSLLRENIGGRSHTYCPRCQTRPRRKRN